MNILLATNNLHKITEVKSILNNISGLKVLSLSDYGLKSDTDETGNTLEENALQKARAVYKLLEIPSLADDTGLFVEALQGEPGVHSARYAGKNASYEINNLKLLDKMKNIPDNKRNAYFETVLCFYKSEKDYDFFRGVCKGKILSSPGGKNGFGYDPLFLPEGFSQTLAEMTEKEKNEISHRRKSLEEFKKSLVQF